jgi:hypothetical protein
MLKYNYDIQNKMPVINDSTQKVYKCFLPLTILSFCLFLIFSGCSSEQEEKHLLEKEKMATVSKIQEESYESNVNTLKDDTSSQVQVEKRNDDKEWEEEIEIVESEEVIELFSGKLEQTFLQPRNEKWEVKVEDESIVRIKLHSHGLLSMWAENEGETTLTIINHNKGKGKRLKLIVLPKKGAMRHHEMSLLVGEEFIFTLDDSWSYKGEVEDESIVKEIESSNSVLYIIEPVKTGTTTVTITDTVNDLKDFYDVTVLDNPKTVAAKVLFTFIKEEFPEMRISETDECGVVQIMRPMMDHPDGSVFLSSSKDPDRDIIIDLYQTVRHWESSNPMTIKKLEAKLKEQNLALSDLPLQSYEHDYCYHYEKLFTLNSKKNIR